MYPLQMNANYLFGFSKSYHEISTIRTRKYELDRSKDSKAELKSFCWVGGGRQDGWEGKKKSGEPEDSPLRSVNGLPAPFRR